MTITTTIAHAAPSAARVHALDHLRALAMLAGVLFHAALAHSPLLHPWWPVADREHSPVVDALVWLPHLLRRPLFFLVAGYFAALVLQRRGMAGLARQRVRRILVPFLVAWPIVHLSIAAATTWAAENIT
ncbi:MAG: acyltransferase family protein, partial [Rhodanobacteraceae bacterium]|nr:acyltransferase family protein [Rhodanobacteraceae bacterium]